MKLVLWGLSCSAGDIPDADDPKSALAVYDAQIANTSAWDMSALADASALLWRLQLRNIRVDERWQVLADRWQTQALTGVRYFYIAHATMALAAAGRTAAAQHILSALPHIQASNAATLHPDDALILPLCKALVAFAYGDYAGCAEWLGRVRYIAHRCGGSLAQCDLIHLTFTEAALRAHRANLGTAQKPASRLNLALQRRLG